MAASLESAVKAYLKAASKHLFQRTILLVLLTLDAAEQ